MDNNYNYSLFKKGVTRLEVAMNGIPDMVPIFAQMHEFIMHDLGFSSLEFYTNPEKMVKGSLEVIQKYRLDVPLIDYDVYNIEAEALGQKIIYGDGVPDVDRGDPLIKARRDLQKIKKPVFPSQGRFSFVCEANTLFSELTGIEPTINFCAPFSLAANIRGIENLIYDIYSKPDFVKELFDRITGEVLIPWISYQLEKILTPQAIVGSDATASIPIINFRILEEWVIPYILKLRKIFGPRLYVPNWTGESNLKNPEQMFSRKLQVCPFLEGQDPDVEKIGPQKYKNYAQRQDVALILGIGTRFLVESDSNKVIEKVKDYVQIGGKNGRFALYLCNLGKTTPPHNIVAAVEAVHRYGRY